MATNKQRREAARRHLERQAQRRQQQNVRRKRLTAIGTAVGTIVILAVVITSVVMLTHDDKKTPTAAGSTTPTATASASASATTAKVPGQCTWGADTTGTTAKTVTKPATTVPTTGTAVATVVTTQGTLTFTMPRAKAPCTVASFVSLAKQKYYDATPCHRLTTTGIYVLQCGDPTGKGTGGPGYTIPDEYTGSEKYTTGVLAMANTGSANTGGSQFFIVYKDTPDLPASYTIFGTVTKGLNVVDKVAAAGATGTTGDGAPKLAISLTKVTVTG